MINTPIDRDNTLEKPSCPPEEAQVHSKIDLKILGLRIEPQIHRTPTGTLSSILRATPHNFALKSKRNSNLALTSSFYSNFMKKTRPIGREAFNAYSQLQ